MNTGARLLAYNPDDVKPGWVALFVVLILAIGTFLLWRNMNKQMGKIKVPYSAEFRKQDGASDRNPAARITKMAAREAKMALRIARWPSGKKDKDPGTLDNRRERKKAAGKPENGASKQNGRPGSQKTGRETKIAVRMTKSRDGTEKTSPGCGEFAPGAGFFDKRSTSGGRWAGPSSWRSCIDAETSGAAVETFPARFSTTLAGRRRRRVCLGGCPPRPPTDPYAPLFPLRGPSAWFPRFLGTIEVLRLP